MKVCDRDWTKAHTQTNAMILLVEAATGGSPCKPTKSAFGKRGWREGPVAIGFFEFTTANWQAPKKYNH